MQNREIHTLNTLRQIEQYKKHFSTIKRSLHSRLIAEQREIRICVIHRRHYIYKTILLSRFIILGAS